MAKHKELDDEALELALEEQRRVYDQLCSVYDQLRIKSLTFLGGSFALLTFLYSRKTDFIPAEQYGKVFYFGGLGLVIGALILLLGTLRPMPWEFPTDRAQERAESGTTKRSYLEYLMRRYFTAYDINIKACKYKQRLLDMAFYPLLIGAIILVVLNLFGG